MDRIKELSDKGEYNYYTYKEDRVTVVGMYKGEGGRHGVCVNRLTDLEVQELRDYNYVSTQEQFDMVKAGEWGTPTTLANGRVYMR